MRVFLIIAFGLPMFAQQPATAPAASTDDWLTGSVDVGYRWETGVGGSFPTYRSLVDLGSGPKLVGVDFSILDPNHRLFDQIDVRATGWGDEPYEALHEQSFDTHRRLGSFFLDILPGNWLIPYVSYDRDSSSGTGATVFVNDVNSFPVPNTMTDRTSLFRGGVRLELKRFHVTVEEGGSTFASGQNVYQTAGSTNYGNSQNPFFGQTADLTGLDASYGISGSSTYTKGLFTANATPWLDLYGQFLFSQPSTNVNYNQFDTGNLALESQLLFYTGQQFILSSAAESPHTEASFGGEIRPFRNVRIIESWLTDRMHESGNATSNQTLANVSVSEATAALLSSSLATNYSQSETDVFYDATARLGFHGGYRYVWGDANDVILPPAGLASADQGKLSRNVGIAGVTFRPIQKLLVSGNLEAAASGGAYFRTSLYNYQKIRAQARYQATASLSLSANFTFLNNQNPVPGVNYDYLASQESLSFLWAPKKTWSFQGSYTRSALYSDIGYLEPETLQPMQSLYRDNAHTATGLFSAKLWHYYGLTPLLSAGGSLFISSGSRPTNYYQPFVKLVLPVRRNLAWFSEWSYYGYGENFYIYEGFRTNLVMTGLRISR
jgi:hypothetical protein